MAIRAKAGGLTKAPLAESENEKERRSPSKCMGFSWFTV